MILLAKDLEKFGITAQEIELKQQGIFVPVISVESECTICLGGLHDLRTLPCGHGFCRKCIENWLKNHRDCPLCRASASAAPAASAAVSLTPQSMYKFLHAKRAVFLDKSSRTRQKQAECAKLMHDQTIRFQEDVVALAKNPQLEDKKQKCLKFLGSRNAVQAKCRLMCLSDATGSMASLWEQTQNSILKMLQRISEISGGSGNIEIKWVAFRDYELDRSKVLEVSNWTDDPTSLVRFVGGIKCLSAPGCDGPEAVEAALNIVNTELEPPTRVVLIGDAPPHYEGTFWLLYVYTRILCCYHHRCSFKLQSNNANPLSDVPSNTIHRERQQSQKTQGAYQQLCIRRLCCGRKVVNRLSKGMRRSQVQEYQSLPFLSQPTCQGHLR